MSCCWRTDSPKVVSTLKQLSERAVGGQTALLVVSTLSHLAEKGCRSTNCPQVVSILAQLATDLLQHVSVLTERTNRFFLSFTQIAQSYMLVVKLLIIDSKKGQKTTNEFSKHSNSPSIDWSNLKLKGNFPY